MATTKRGVNERATVIARVMELHCLGWSEREIAKEMEVSQPQVHYDLKQAEALWLEKAVDDRRMLVLKETETLRWTRAEAVKGFLRSMEDARKVQTKKVGPRPCRACLGLGKTNNGKKCKSCAGKGQWVPPDEITDTVEGRLPATEYLRVVIETHNKIAEMYGLREAIKLDVTATTINWDQLAGATGPVLDAIEGQLLKIAAEINGTSSTTPPYPVSPPEE